MGRDIPELDHNTPFEEKIRRAFEPADAGLVERANAFLAEKRCAADSTASQSYPAANLLLEQNADAVTVAAALLAPLVWADRADTAEIRQTLDPAVAETLTDLGSPFIPHSKLRPYQREAIGGLLAALGGAPRKALLFITFRLLTLERLAGAGEKVSRPLAQETLDLFVPIANCLSLGELRRRLEDACFRILDPAGYKALRKAVLPIQAEDDRCLEILLAGVRRVLDNNGIQARIQGRTKSLHAIRRKMNRTGKSLEAIMDRVGLRVIVGSVPECYAVLGLLHAHFKPIPGTFDDYIGLPKDNGYQSLHTCVYPVREISHKPIEFQVRTELMHMEAEHGTAAHWRYKCRFTAPSPDHQRSRWMKGLARQHQEAESTEAFIERLHQQVFTNYRVVFGNRGRIVRLSDSATVKDYLKIANVRVPPGARVKVNGFPAPLDQPLKDGDSVEVPDIGDIASHATDTMEGYPNWQRRIHETQMNRNRRNHHENQTVKRSRTGETNGGRTKDRRRDHHPGYCQGKAPAGKGGGGRTWQAG